MSAPREIGISLQKVLRKKLKSPHFRYYFSESKSISDLCYKITQARQAKGFTQERLAKACGTTQSVIARLESGNNGRMPSLDLLNRIANALNLNLVLGFEKKAA